MSSLRYTFRTMCVATAIALVTLSLGSCNLAPNQMAFDRGIDKNFQDYRDALVAQPLPPKEVADTPDFKPIMSMPADLKLPSPLVTVSVNQTVALSDLMFELAEQSGVDVELDPQIRGSIIFTAKERPFNEVVDRICEMAGLRYTFKNNILRVELDRPFVKSYKLDYMNVGRKSASEIKTDLSVTGGGETVSSGSSSSAEISNSYQSNLWKEISDGLKEILAASDTYLPLATLSTPAAMPVPAPAPVAPQPTVGPDGALTTPPPLPGADPALAALDQSAAVPVTAPPTLNITQESDLPAMPNAPATYTISREAGVVTIFASQRQQKVVQKFLDDFRRIMMTQVLIEAKVLEVSLKDEFAAGIDWNKFNITGAATVRASLPSAGLTPAAAAANVFTTTLNLHDVAPVIDAMSRYGTVRALSSPRVTVMNSQPAVVNVTNNSVYFDIVTTTIPPTVAGGAPTVTSTATVKTAPEGVMMHVLPIVNPDTGEIQMAIRPSISKINAKIADPINAGNSVPELLVQQIDSVVKLQSGQTMVMGGLMRDQASGSRLGVPIVNEIPVLGALFRNHADSVQKSELVIFLRASIVPGNNIEPEDRKIYNTFSHDRRPVRM